MRLSREQEQQIEVDLAGQVIELTPEEWTSAQMTASASVSDGSLSLIHEIIGPPNQRELIMVPDEVFSLSKRLYDSFCSKGDPWKSFIITVTNDGTEWSYKIRYLY